MSMRWYLTSETWTSSGQASLCQAGQKVINKMIEGSTYSSSSTSESTVLAAFTFRAGFLILKRCQDRPTKYQVFHLLSILHIQVGDFGCFQKTSRLLCPEEHFRNEGQQYKNKYSLNFFAI